MTLVRDSSHVVRRVVPLPEPSKMKRYWILLLPVLLVLFQVIAVGLRPLGIRPTLSAALLTAVVADLLTVGIAFFLVARSPGNRLARLGLEVPRRKRDLLFLPIVGGILTFVGLALADAVYALLTGGQLPPPQAVTQALAESEDPGLRILAVLAVGLVAPFAEEIVFRGVSFRGLRRSLGFLP
ncbi:MAG TPA: CPBP family glutamic-type intramembrane protease, partial [Planctomycetota bacterium]|nr:CPBP family glutamic-type intramembrane protease [Planctomycetota bacterium]